ncbi:MAG: hypothetical protein COU69_03745 [Candidatus Pacebacteria bacterium CG10_big_fil_rev_8_21_14_0_10_56_10]|nr:MAG: hypothetical protein COU69_03745 [Candidatus Pacebacteria bacterium CG10_big_fil_rev_8_21_14_0_10_56_10]
MPENVSLVVTVLNEAATINSLLTSVAKQSRLPEEVVMVDGGSSDGTVRLVRRFAADHPQLNLKLIEQPGNRSVGRNAGITAASHDWIAITDAGCTLHQHWLAELMAAAARHHAEVVAGYYQGDAHTPFEQAVVPYALVMPDRLDPASFLPATRSMLIDRSIWRRLGKFDERLSDNEDYSFALLVKAAGIKLAVARQAVVSWRPRSDLVSFWWMIFRFAAGDVAAGIVRPKVLLVFGRYLLALAVLVAFGSLAVGWLLMVLVAYAGWSIAKNYRHAPQGWYWLPVLQLAADSAVLVGSTAGLVRGKRF